MIYSPLESITTILLFRLSTTFRKKLPTSPEGVILCFPTPVADDSSGDLFDARDTPAMMTSPIAMESSLRADI